MTATRFQLAGVLLVIAGVLMLAGAFSRSWEDGRWKIGGGDDQALSAGPLGVRDCEEAGCYARGWSSLRDETGSTLLGPALGIGEIVAGGYALVVGLLAIGGSVGAFRPIGLRFGFAALAALAVLFVLRLLTTFEEGGFGEGMVFGVLGPLLAFLTLDRTVKPALIEHDLDLVTRLSE